MTSRHVLYVSGTRADYGLMRGTLRAIERHPELRLSLLVTGMHLSEDFGETVRDIERDRFTISARVPILLGADSPAAMARALGQAILGMTDVLEHVQPAFILLEGDRGEALAAGIAAAHMNIAVAHISGGDVTGTIIDESIRHAITKFAHVHFPGTWLSARRLLRMGEDPWRVHMVGTPGADLAGELEVPTEAMASALGLDLSRRLVLVLQHPVTTEVADAGRQMRETMEAVAGLREQVVVIYPNADAGGREMARIIGEYDAPPHVRTFKSLPRPLYVTLLSATSVMVGNSSSALTDAPNFGVPAINVGTRQQGRERGGNLVDVAHARDEIRQAILEAMVRLDDPAFRTRCRQSPYEDVNAAARIADVLATVGMGPRLIQKRFFDGAPEDRGEREAAHVDRHED